jgi:5'-methylthioinosine phosphorylase
VAIGLIVGSGYDRLGLVVRSRSPAKTPFGAPSSPLLRVELAGVELCCIARHGEIHALAPHEINYRANMWLLREHGVTQCIAVGSVGAIAAELCPGQLAIPEQIIDYTWGRAQSFAGTSEPAPIHIDFTEPFDRALRARLVAAAAEGASAATGTYGVTQGPRLETAAEIERLARDGCTMVGMTAMPEAALARELGLAYALCAVAVNWAAGRSPREEGIHAQLAVYTATGMRAARRCLERLLASLDV